MIEQAISRLQYLCDTIPGLLNKINEKEFSLKPGPDRWSKKEIIGHLIVSATHNHHRFIRGQFEEMPLIKYDQNQWNKYSYFNEMESGVLISLWNSYNNLLLETIKLLPENSLNKMILTGGDNSVTLEFIIIDYIRHLEHHLQKVVAY